MKLSSRAVAVAPPFVLGAALVSIAIAVACNESTAPTATTLPDGSVAPAPTATTPGPQNPAVDAALPDAGAYDEAHCSGESDPYWSKVLAYVPCTTDISDVAGKSTLTPYNGPTVSPSPAGAPGGASCSLGNAASFATAKGFGIKLPEAIGTSDFTVEVTVYQTAWYDPTDQQSEILIGISAYPPGPGKFPSFFSHSGIDSVQYIGGTAAVSYRDAGGVLNEWDAYAASRIGGTVYVFRNGALLTSFADPTDYTDTTAFVGHQSNGAYNAVMGSVAQIRITTAARYKGGYTACTGGFATQ